MNLRDILCPRCQAPLAEIDFNQSQLAPCPACAAPLQVEIFPALYRPVLSGREGEAVLIGTESSCFYHPQKKASVPCDACGRFLCALCDCELHGKHYCPACLETGRTKGKIASLENKRTLYDSVALSLSLLPLLIFYFTIITAPITLYIVIRYWNAPRSIVHRTRIRYIFAVFIALLQIVGWSLGLYFLFRKAS